MEHLKKSKCLKDTIWIYALVLVLVGFGALMVYSASFYSAEYHYGNRYFFLYKQIMGIVLGIFAMVFFTFFD